jgi:hypothetical protein
MAGGPSPRIPPATFPPRGLSRPYGPGADSTGSQIRASLAALSGRTGRADLRAEEQAYRPRAARRSARSVRSQVRQCLWSSPAALG